MGRINRGMGMAANPLGAHHHLFSDSNYSKLT